MLTAEDRAHQVINDHCINEAGFVSFPIDPYAVARSLGITVEHRIGLPPNVDGLLIKESPESPILAVINADTAPNRQRFTLAHEIGHYTYIRDHEPARLKNVGLVEWRDETSRSGTDPQEIDANAFAAGLLMPEWVVRLWAYEGKTRAEMAKKFGVSSEAMGNRLNKLSLSHIV